MDGERTCSWPRAQPVADELAVEHQRASGGALVFRPLAFCAEWAMCDADGWEVEHRAEVERESGSARVVATGGVDQEHVRRLRQRAYGSFEQGALAQRE
jgi:hypothetical protein